MQKNFEHRLDLDHLSDLVQHHNTNSAFSATHYKYVHEAGELRSVIIMAELEIMGYLFTTEYYKSGRGVRSCLFYFNTDLDTYIELEPGSMAGQQLEHLMITTYQHPADVFPRDKFPVATVEEGILKLEQLATRRICATLARPGEMPLYQNFPDLDRLSTTDALNVLKVWAAPVTADTDQRLRDYVISSGVKSFHS